MGSVLEGGGHRSPGVLDVDPASSRVVADLRHPHLTAMKSVPDGVEPELASGCSLTELQMAAELPLRISLRILLDVLSGIAAIHHAKLDGKRIGFVHGEVAPANIIVGRDGVARLVPLSRGQGAKDTNLVGYQAPELLLGDAVDQRADVFSAGVLLWEAMSGKRLFPDMPGEEIVTQLIGGKVQPPPAPRDAPWAGELSAVAMQALDVDPSQRWPHVGALGSTIENIAHIYVAVPAELATFVNHALGGGSRSSFPDEATTQRRVLSERPSTPAPESLAAVSTPVHPESALVVAAPPPVALDLPNVPAPSAPMYPPDADLSESFPPLPRRRKGRWVVFSGVLASCVALALVAGHKFLQNNRVTAGVTVLPGPELARPAAAAATARDAPPPLPVTAAAVTSTPAARPAPSPAPFPPPSPPPPATTQAKSAHGPGRPAVAPVAAPRPAPPPPPAAAPPPPAAAPPPAPPPAATPAPVQKPKPAADQFGI